jgi:hypothetical protein
MLASPTPPYYAASGVGGNSHPSSYYLDEEHRILEELRHVELERRELELRRRLEELRNPSNVNASSSQSQISVGDFQAPRPGPIGDEKLLPPAYQFGPE